MAESVAKVQQRALGLVELQQPGQLALTSMLMAPEYLFRVETAEPDPAKAGAYRLDAYSKAERLSYLLWDTAPDEALLPEDTSHTDPNPG